MTTAFQRDPSFGLHSIMGTQRTLTNTIYDTSKIPTLDLPSISPGDPLPYVFGTRKIASPKIFYFGNLKPLFATDTKVSTAQGVMAGLSPDPNGYANQAILTGGGDGDSSTPIPVPLRTGRVGSSQSAVNPYLDASQQLPQRSYVLPGTMPNIVFQDTIDTTVTLSDYSIDVGIAICLGEGVRLQKIFAGDTLLWQGDLTGFQVVQNIDVDGNGAQLFPQLGSGFIFHDGGFNQAIDSYLVATADDPTLISALPGIAYVVIAGVASSIAKGASYSFEVQRMPNRLALSSDVQSNGADLNAASALVDILSNDWGALGIELGNIDVAAFTAAAIQFKAENLFVSDMITNDGGGVTSVKEIQAITNSLLYCDPSTGFITITLLRDTILTTTPPIFIVTPSKGAAIQSYKKPDWSVLPTAFEIVYQDRTNDYQSAHVDAANPAIPPPKDRRNNKSTFTENCICASDVAASALLLMMQTQSAPKITATLILNRIAANALPGQTLLLTWPEYGIELMPFRILKWREFDNQQIALDVEQYQFLAVTKYFSVPEPTGYVRKDITVKPPADIRIVSAPLLLTRWGMVQSTYQLTLLYDFLVCLIEPGNDYQAHAALYDPVSGLQLQDNMNYSPTAKLVSALAKEAGQGHSMLKELVIEAPVFFGAIAKSQDYPRINALRQKPVIIFLGDEILTYERLTKNDDETWTLHNVYRGLIDTVAGDHAAGDKLWFYDGNDASKMIAGRVYNDLRPTPYAFVGIDLNGRRSSAVTAPVVTPVPTDRAQRPLRVVQPRINGHSDIDGPVNVKAGDPIVIEWKNRTRVNDNVAIADDDSDPNEQGINDPLYHWQPVVRVVFSGVLTDEISNRFAWDVTDGPDDTISTATGVFSYVIPSGLVGLGTVTLTAVWFDYLNGTDFGLHSLPVSIGFNAVAPTEFAADFVFDYKIGFAVDFTFDYEMLITLPTLIFI